MIVLGINPGHDGTAVLVTDAGVAAAVAEERLSRIKAHLGFPSRAIESVLALAGVSPDAVDAVAFGFREYLQAPPFITRALLNPDGCSIPLDDAFGMKRLREEWIRQARGGAWSPPFPVASPAFRRATLRLYEEALRVRGITARIVPVDHHLSHAASAYYTSPYPDCLVVTADGAGDGLSGTWNRTHSGTIERIQASTGAFSVGKMYSAVTKFLGFTPHRHEGKVTGLAAYGDPRVHRETLRACLGYDGEHGGFTTRLSRSRVRHLLEGIPDFLGERFLRDPYFDGVLKFCRSRLRQARPEDVAAAAQDLLDSVMARYVGDGLKATGHGYIAAAGGVFANVRMNHVLAGLPGVRGVYIHPNMGDGGTALGAALHVHRTQSGAAPERSPVVFDPYLGPEYPEREIEDCLVRRGVAYSRPVSIEETAATLVAEGRIVGRFDGKMEYGPRALGNRSVLAHPGIPGIHKSLNDRLHRTEFMPFAPSILDSHAGDACLGLTERAEAARYMTICFDVAPERRALFGEACHVDGTARAQIVHRETNPSFHKLIAHFHRISGIPLLLNTSFNNHEEPIVCSPEDAVRTLLGGSIDALAIGPFLARHPAAP